MLFLPILLLLSSLDAPLPTKRVQRAEEMQRCRDASRIPRVYRCTAMQMQMQNLLLSRAIVVGYLAARPGRVLRQRPARLSQPACLQARPTSRTRHMHYCLVNSDYTVIYYGLITGYDTHTSLTPSSPTRCSAAPIPQSSKAQDGSS